MYGDLQVDVKTLPTEVLLRTALIGNGDDDEEECIVELARRIDAARAAAPQPKETDK